MLQCDYGQNKPTIFPLLVICYTSLLCCKSNRATQFPNFHQEIWNIKRTHTYQVAQTKLSKNRSRYSPSSQQNNLLQSSVQGIIFWKHNRPVLFYIWTYDISVLRICILLGKYRHVVKDWVHDENKTGSQVRSQSWLHLVSFRKQDIPFIYLTVIPGISIFW